MGATDKAFRILVAIIVGILYFNDIISGTLGIILLIVSSIFILTSIISFCPLYAPFKISTCKIKENE